MLFGEDILTTEYDLQKSLLSHLDHMENFLHWFWQDNFSPSLDEIRSKLRELGLVIK